MKILMLKNWLSPFDIFAVLLSGGLMDCQHPFTKFSPDGFRGIFRSSLGTSFYVGPCFSPSALSVLTLLHKSECRSDPGNCRPIYMMQEDVTILIKSFTYRMCWLMPKLIHVEQKGFIPGRSPHHHVRFLSYLQHLLSATDEDNIAVFLDFTRLTIE